MFAALVGAMYLSHNPVWDDHYLIHTLKQRSIVEIWSQPVGGGDVGDAYFRPLPMSFIAFLPNVFWLKLIVTLCHCLSTLAVYRIALNHRLAAFPAALIFAVHPISSEVLGWASCLPDALAVCAGLWSVERASKGWIFPAILMFLGLLSKETALLPLLGYLLIYPSRKGWFAWAIPVAGIAALRQISGVNSSWNLSDKLELVPLALGIQLKGLLWPFPQQPVRDLLVVSSGVALLALCGIMALGLIVRTRPQLRLGIWLLISPLLLSLPPTIDGYLAAERYSYMSVAGVSLVFSVLLKRWPKWLLIGAASSLLVVHWSRSEVWQSDRALFEKAVQSMPSSSYAWHFLGMVERSEERWQPAALAFQRAVNLGHPYPTDRELALDSLVRSEQFTAALAWAVEGPQSGLSKHYLELWIMAANETGNTQMAEQISQALER